MELRILTNYGNEDCTCIYRFRVHGASYAWMQQYQEKDDGDGDRKPVKIKRFRIENLPIDTSL